MTQPWFHMDGSVFRIRPVTRAGWAVVLVAFAIDVLLTLAAAVAVFTTDDLKWVLLPVVGFPAVLAVLFLVIAATTPRTGS
ncbi:hypothetical protein [Brevundimonas sp.]|uniref:hypothetical protein n=1 Tax=Brevundimonas sp. TaxID=1871086 RepID=UPI0025FF6D2A|nr:hypothetical protein [Brevundimonas sp.]